MTIWQRTSSLVQDNQLKAPFQINRNQNIVDKNNKITSPSHLKTANERYENKTTTVLTLTY